MSRDTSWQDTYLEEDRLRKHICPFASLKEVALFKLFCQHHNVNPFLGEVFYLQKEGYNGSKPKPPQIIISQDVFYKRADSTPMYDGMESGVVGERDGEMKEFNGAVCPADWEITGAWAKVYRKDRSHPTYVTVRFAEFVKMVKEYVDRKPTGRETPNHTWKTMPGVMIVKCADSTGLRKAFPNEFMGLYGAAEFGESEPDKLELKDKEIITNPVSVQEGIDYALQNPVDMTPPKVVLGTPKEIKTAYMRIHVNPDVLAVRCGVTSEFEIGSEASLLTWTELGIRYTDICDKGIHVESVFGDEACTRAYLDKVGAATNRPEFKTLSKRFSEMVTKELKEWYLSECDLMGSKWVE